MESFEIPDSIHKLFLNASSKTLKIMHKNMLKEKECPEIGPAYELGINLQKYLGVWIVCLLSIVGILLNTLCIRVSASILNSKKAPRNLFNMLLLNLLSWDTIFLILNISRKIANLVNNDLKCLAALILIPLWNIALAQSVFATLFMSIERYICIIHEKTYRKYIQSNEKRMSFFLHWVMPMTLLVFLAHIPEFLSQNPDVEIENGSKCTRKEEGCTNPDKNAPNVDVYFKVFVKVFIDGFFPLICLLYCNTRTFLKVRKDIRKSLRIPKNIEIRPLSDSQKKIEEQNKKLIRAIEHKLAKIMIGIVSVFILCQIPYLVLTASQSILITKWLMGGKDTNFGMYPPYIVIMEPIVHLMLTFNCSVNVIFYCFFDSGYRDRIFPCINSNQGRDGKISGIIQEENKEKDVNEELNSLKSQDKDEKDSPYGDDLFVN